MGASPGGDASAVEWVQLPSTAVPHGSWGARHESGAYNGHWWSSGGWCSGGWNLMRGGAGSTSGHAGYASFDASYNKENCWFGGMDGWAEKDVYLDRFRTI